ncbi:hypothetical protein [Caulobacter sp. S45]|uniref:hypothetical protein n=1 Tax=Caulobacter sp. S45 TaxID=1641861 RepID=UPI00131D207E|nr:hypothetical protein [Caulobacter sp. S45]
MGDLREQPRLKNRDRAVVFKIQPITSAALRVAALLQTLTDVRGLNERCSG